MNTRSHDWEVLRKASLSHDPVVRKQAKVAMERIKHEGSKVKSMREALVRATRDGNRQEIEDIHDFIKNRPEYKTWGQDKVWKDYE
jgi:hypothetical protein